MKALRSLRDEGGQSTVETIALLPLILLMFLMAIEAFAFMMTIEEVDSAARTGARVGSQGGDGERAAYGALPNRLHNRDTRIQVRNTGIDITSTVSAQVPMIMSGAFDWRVTRTVRMPLG